MSQTDQQFEAAFRLTHIGRNKSAETINIYLFPFVKLTFLFICLTILTILVKKELYQAIDALDLSQNK